MLLRIDCHQHVPESSKCATHHRIQITHGGYLSCASLLPYCSSLQTNYHFLVAFHIQITVPTWSLTCNRKNKDGEAADRGRDYVSECTVTCSLSYHQYNISPLLGLVLTHRCRLDVISKCGSKINLCNSTIYLVTSADIYAGFLQGRRSEYTFRCLGFGMPGL